MQACCDVAFDYAHQREQFGKKIGTYQVHINVLFTPMCCIHFEATKAIKNIYIYIYYSYNLICFLAVARQNGRYVHTTKCHSFLCIQCG